MSKNLQMFGKYELLEPGIEPDTAYVVRFKESRGEQEDLITGDKGELEEFAENIVREEGEVEFDGHADNIDCLSYQGSSVDSFLTPTEFLDIRNSNISYREKLTELGVPAQTVALLPGWVVEMLNELDFTEILAEGFDSVEFDEDGEEGYFRLLCSIVAATVAGVNYTLDDLVSSELGAEVVNDYFLWFIRLFPLEVFNLNTGDGVDDFSFITDQEGFVSTIYSFGPRATLAALDHLLLMLLKHGGEQYYRVCVNTLAHILDNYDRCECVDGAPAMILPSFVLTGCIPDCSEG